MTREREKNKTHALSDLSSWTLGGVFGYGDTLEAYGDRLNPLTSVCVIWCLVRTFVAVGGSFTLLDSCLGSCRFDGLAANST